MDRSNPPPSDDRRIHHYCRGCGHLYPGDEHHPHCPVANGDAVAEDLVDPIIAIDERGEGVRDAT